MLVLIHFSNKTIYRTQLLRNLSQSYFKVDHGFLSGIRVTNFGSISFFFSLFFCFVLFFCCFCVFILFFVFLCVCLFFLSHYYSAPTKLLRCLFVRRTQPVSVSLQAQLKKNFLQVPLPYVVSNSVYQRLKMCHHPLVKIYSKSICDQFQSHRET